MSGATATATADVVVVGGGPVGLLVASELALHGVHVVLVERHADVVDHPKAGTLQARPLQLLRRRGYLPTGPIDADEGAVVQASFHFAAQVRFPVTSPAPEGSPVVNIWQGELERILEAVCHSRGVEILRRHDVTAIDERAGDVEVTIDGPHERRRVVAGWVVGADGARSIVRRTAGIDATDHPATMRALVGRARFTDPGRLPIGWHETPQGWTLVNFVPGGLSRLVTFEFDGPPVDHRAPVSGAELAESAARIHGRALPFDDLVYAGRFSDFSRVAHTYRAGRLLIAGDAAHIHYPVGGQGLGLGIQDAFNLGWKLAAVVGGASDALLDTYVAERQPHAERVVSYTRDQAAAMRPSAVATPQEWARRVAILEQVGSAAGRERIAAFLSSQWVRTTREPGDDPAVGTFAHDRRVRTVSGSTRLSALLAGGRAVLIGPPVPTLDDLVRRWGGRVEVIHDHAGDAHHTLVRPDGYVAWRGTAEALGLVQALERWFGPAEREHALSIPQVGPSRLDSTLI